MSSEKNDEVSGKHIIETYLTLYPTIAMLVFHTFRQVI